MRVLLHIYSVIKEVRNPDDLLLLHYILHQQNLCDKSTNLNVTLEKIVGIVNYIHANATGHRQFRDKLLLDNQVISIDLPYHFKVRWLSQGKVLVKILSLRQKIIKFYQKK